jgi:hypothetical protein
MPSNDPGGSAAGHASPKRAYVRRFGRYRVDKRIRVISGGAPSKTVLHGRCHILSEGGFGAVVAGNLRERQIVQIEFSMDHIDQPFHLTAEVRYVNGFHHGFEFVAPTHEQKSVITELFAESVRVG